MSQGAKSGVPNPSHCCPLQPVVGPVHALMQPPWSQNDGDVVEVVELDEVGDVVPDGAVVEVVDVDGSVVPDGAVVPDVPVTGGDPV